MVADPTILYLERLFTRTGPVCAAWARREEAFAYACRARPDELGVALVEWCIACADYAGAVASAALHDVPRVQRQVAEAVDYASVFGVNAARARERRLRVVPDLQPEGVHA
jgi:hypothetical protein